MAAYGSNPEATSGSAAVEERERTGAFRRKDATEVVSLGAAHPGPAGGQGRVRGPVRELARRMRPLADHRRTPQSGPPAEIARKAHMIFMAHTVAMIY